MKTREAMKVREVIDALSKHDPEAEVYVEFMGHTQYPLGERDIVTGPCMDCGGGITAEHMLGGWLARATGEAGAFAYSGLHEQLADAVADAKARLEEAKNGQR